jgi:hypothetical protein
VLHIRKNIVESITPREYTHAHKGGQRLFKERRRRDQHLVVSPIKRDAVYLNKK